VLTGGHQQGCREASASRLADKRQLCRAGVRSGDQGLVDSQLPLRRVAEVEDVAKAYLQLMDQDYATGTVSVIDGGTVLV